MNPFPLLALCLLFTLSVSLAQSPALPVAEDNNLLVHIQIFGVPPASAAIISKDAALQSDDAVFLRQMEKWLAEKKIQLRANPTVLVRSGQRSIVEGNARLEMEATREGVKKAHVNLAVDHGSGADSGTSHIQKEINISLGTPVYLGSMEVPADPTTKSPAATCFIFLSAQ